MKRTILFLVVGCAFPSVANAQSAESLFQEGNKLMDAGKYQEACSKFAASEQFDPACGTLFNLADCHERIGELQLALEEFRKTAQMAHITGKVDREQKATQRAEALEPKVKPAEKAPLSSKPVSAPEVSFPPQRIAALGVAGIGLASVVLGTVSGLNASSKWSSAQDGHCNVKDQCDSVGRGLVDDAKSAAAVSSVGFIAGSGLLAASAVLWFTAPKSSVVVSPTVGGLYVRGIF